MGDTAGDQLPKLEADLAALDREWQREREHYMVRGKDGKLHEPAAGAHLAPAILLMVGGTVIMAFVAASPLPTIAAYAGLPPFAWGTYRLLTGSVKSEGYERCLTAYESRRNQLCIRIARARQDDGAENSR